MKAFIPLWFCSKKLIAIGQKIRGKTSVNRLNIKIAYRGKVPSTLNMPKGGRGGLPADRPAGLVKHKSFNPLKKQGHKQKSKRKNNNG